MSTPFHHYLFDGSVAFLHIAYVALAFGILDQAPNYLEAIDYWVKVFMSLFLLWRFNPWAKIAFSDFDRRVVFSAGMFLFTVTIVNNYLISYVEKGKAFGKSAVQSVRSSLAS
ncbi:MAG: hypothetical protein NTW02_10315 [Cyanobium sp. LacPavin_0920_WC12_MAG_62_9]|nr:hypothetical protein [Cyanobium sp. LacPavin_0920_WC12_MAG_62_9]